MGGESGPFRRDARIERTAETAPYATAMAVLRRMSFPGLELPGYLLVVGAAAIPMAIGLVERPVATLVVGAGLVLLGLWTRKHFRAHRARVQRGYESTAFRCVFTPDAVLLEGASTRTAWRYDAIRDVRRSGGWLVVTISNREWLVLRAEGEEGAALAQWLIARASHLERGPRTTTVLLLLAVLYVTLVAGSLALAPGFTAPW